MTKKYLALVTVLALAACATAAQRQSQQIAVNTRATTDQLRSCGLAVYYSPEAAPLRPHLPQDIRDATLEQMTNSANANDEEIRAIYTVHPRLQQCRKAALESLAQTTPTIVPILADGWGRAELSLIDLIQRKISWGNYIRHVKEVNTEMMGQVTTAYQQIGANLQRSHQAEMAQRQAASNAMMQFYQNQQLINAVNRPVFTNCQGFGNMVNCVSH